ncbi:MAG: hypothetical protein ACFBSE_10580 [Prochloraceae cyanobacterium]
MKHIFFDVIKQENISDILLSGVVDIENGIAEFTPMLTYMFFQFDTKIIKFESIEQYSKLKIEYIDSVTYDFEIEEDMYPAKSSIIEIIMTDTMADNSINSIEIYGYFSENNKVLICDAICFKLNCGQELFLDPTYFFGINVGSNEQKKAWLNNYPNTKSNTIKKTLIELV